MHAFAVHLMKLKTVDCTTMNNRLERMWKETVVGYVKVLGIIFVGLRKITKDVGIPAEMSMLSILSVLLNKQLFRKNVKFDLN